MTKEARMTKSEKARQASTCFGGFLFLVLCHSFAIRHSTFVI